VLDSCTVCDGGLASPIRYAKFALLVLSDSTGGAVTFAVTVTICGLPVAPGALTVTFPVWLPTVTRDGLSVIRIVLGVAPLVGLTEIQGESLVTVKFTLPLAAVTGTGWPSGAASPCR
jgi:hypothetical protein